MAIMANFCVGVFCRNDNFNDKDEKLFFIVPLSFIAMAWRLPKLFIVQNIFIGSWFNHSSGIFLG